MSDATKQSMVAKVVGAGVALVAVWAVHKTLDAVWTKARGHKPPPADSTAEDIKVSEVIAAAAISGAAVAVSRVVATRATAKFAGRVGRNRPTLGD